MKDTKSFSLLNFKLAFKKCEIYKECMAGRKRCHPVTHFCKNLNTFHAHFSKTVKFLESNTFSKLFPRHSFLASFIVYAKLCQGG